MKAIQNSAELGAWAFGIMREFVQFLEKFLRFAEPPGTRIRSAKHSRGEWATSYKLCDRFESAYRLLKLPCLEARKTEKAVGPEEDFLCLPRRSDVE